MLGPRPSHSSGHGRSRGRLVGRKRRAIFSEIPVVICLLLLRELAGRVVGLRKSGKLVLLGHARGLLLRSRIESLGPVSVVVEDSHVLLLVYRLATVESVVAHISRR